MSDDIDIANDRAQLHLDNRIAEARRAPVVDRSGVCLNPDCGSKAKKGGLYCSDDCKDEHRRFEAIRAKQFRK